MEAREEKLLRARASFRNEGGPNNFYERRAERVKTGEEDNEKDRKDSRKIFLGARILISILLLVLFILADMSKNNEVGKLSEKIFAETQKNELNVEKYSALIGEMW